MLGGAVASLLPAVPRPVVRRLSARYIAGLELADAVSSLRARNAGGKAATLDVLGEEVRRPEQAAAIVAEYLGSLEAIEREGLDANVSVKPTAIGPRLGRDAARGHLETLARAADGRGNFVRLDMEDSSTTSSTLALYRELRAEGLDNIGVVLQAGVKPELADALIGEGRRVRIYVPYGRRWYEYSLRRLRENPLVAGYVASDLLRRVVPRSGRRA